MAPMAPAASGGMSPNGSPISTRSLAFFMVCRTETPARRVTCTMASGVSAAASFMWIDETMFQNGLMGP